MTGEFPTWLVGLAPLGFIAFWILITQLLASHSGWNALQDQYPDTDEPAIRTLRFQSGSFRRINFSLRRVNYGGVLTLSATRTGLRVSVWKIFGPFQRRFLVPWNAMTLGTRRGLMGSAWAELRIAGPEEITLSLPMSIWEWMAVHSGGQVKLPALTPMPDRWSGRRYLLQWLAFTAGGAAFFQIASRVGDGAPVPLAPTIILPAIVLGIGHLVAFIRSR